MLIILITLFLPIGPVYADGPSVKILEPASGAVIQLDYNEFNIKIQYHVDKYENRGGISLYITGQAGTREMEDGYVQAYSPSNVYPDDDTRDRRVWVGDLPPGTYTITAELWSWKLKPGTSSEYINNQLVASDQISIVLPSKPGDEPDPTIAWPTATADIPLPTATSDLPQPPVGIDPGAIYISSSPGNAEIWINGIYQVDTNASIDNQFGFTDLAPGTYVVTLRKQGYLDYTEVVNLHSFEIYDIRAVMEPGVTSTGWIIVNTDPGDVRLYLNNTQVAIAPTTLTDVPPGTYDLRLKKDGYEDWYDTVTVYAGQITTVNASLPAASGGFPIGAVAGGAAIVAGSGLLIKKMSGRGKKAVTKAPKSLYDQWFEKATPEERKNWDSFEKFLRMRMGAPRLNNFQDVYGNPSWASAHQSWAQEVKNGKTKASFEEWVNDHSANQEVVKGMKEWAERNKDVRDPGIVEASKNYSEALRNKERFQRLTQLKKAVSGDANLTDFANDAGNAIVKDGIVDANKLNRLEGTLKRWIVRDKLIPQTPDYTYSDAFFDSVNQGSKNIVVRIGSAYLTGGYSEMALNPISAVSSMRQNIMDGDSAAWAVTKGFAQSGMELGLGESGRLLKYAKPLVDKAKDGVNMWRLGKINPNLKAEVSNIQQLAAQTEGQMTRSGFMKTSEVAKAGQTPLYKLNSAEKYAMEMNNNPEFRKLLAENSNLVPSNVKEVVGIAKQKVYEQARNEAAEQVMNQMAKDSVNVKDPFFIRQTGTHAQPGNPGWNSLKSDFDHTVEFGSSKYNQLYESKFNASLEAQGTSAKAMDANVYGTGTSSRGAYEGGAKKFVEHYNETSGSDIMIRNVKGTTTITREVPQQSTSLLSKMNANDVKTAEANYQNFFKKDIAKGGSLDNQIANGSKTVSRNAGQYSAKYVENFKNTGKVNYEPPPAAKVADLVKKQGYSVNDAMKKVGYNGSKEQLFNDFKKIMGM